MGDQNLVRKLSIRQSDFNIADDPMQSFDSMPYWFTTVEQSSHFLGCAILWPNGDFICVQQQHCLLNIQEKSPHHNLTNLVGCEESSDKSPFQKLLLPGVSQIFLKQSCSYNLSSSKQYSGLVLQRIAATTNKALISVFLPCKKHTFQARVFSLQNTENRSQVPGY